MNVVNISVHCFDVERGVLLHNLKQPGDEDWFDIVLDEFTFVLRTPDDVILMLVPRMIEAANSHEYSLPQTHAFVSGIPFTPRQAETKKTTIALATAASLGFPGKEKPANCGRLYCLYDY